MDDCHSEKTLKILEEILNELYQIKQELKILRLK